MFFQVEGKQISDYFLIELFEDKVEESFLELKDYISSAVKRLKMIAPVNRENLHPIFESMKQGVKFTKFRKIYLRMFKYFLSIYY